MADHRVKLTDEDAALIVNALTSRMAGSSRVTRVRLWRLAERLGDIGRGNPDMRFALAEMNRTVDRELRKP